MHIKNLKINYVVSIIALIGLALLGAHRSKQTAPASKDLKPEDVKITNKTRAFEVTRIEKADAKFLRVNLKNSYDKTITAFQASLGKVKLYEELIVNSNSCILPGTSYTRLFSATESFSLDAVVFEDGSGDGDPLMIKEVLDIRSGKAKVFRHFVSAMQKVLESNDHQLGQNLVSLKKEFANSADDESASSDEQYGFESGRTELLEEIQRIEKANGVNGDVRQKLDAYTKDLQRFCQRVSKTSQRSQ